LTARGADAQNLRSVTPRQTHHPREVRVAIIRFERSAATVSWIDPTTKLPEVDEVKPNGSATTRTFLTGDAGFRFCNFIDAWIAYDTVAKRVTGFDFSPASRLYRAPSFLGIPSHVFQPKRNKTLAADGVTFGQIVGARTESPEVIGKATGGTVGETLGRVIAGPLGGEIGKRAGGQVGEKAAREISGFPPIWAQLRMKILNDGRFQAELLQYSLFPSLTFYKVQLDATSKQTPNYQRVSVTAKDGFYDAVPSLDKWKKEGWGPIKESGNATGPTAGNPWELQK
jgi:hypothetical protein